MASTSSAASLDEEVEAILQQHRESAKLREQQRIETGISTTVASLAKTLETVAKARAACQQSAGGESKEEQTSAVPKAAKAPRKPSKPKKTGPTLPKANATKRNTSSAVETSRKRTRPSEQSKWGIPTVKELKDPFHDTMAAIAYLQKHGVLVHPPYSCPRCNKPLPPPKFNNNQSLNSAPEWRCRKGACSKKEWRQSFWHGSVVHRMRNNITEWLQLLYYWCVLGVSKHHTTGTSTASQTFTHQTNLHKQIAIMLGWTQEGVCSWTRKLRQFVSHYGLTDTGIDRHGKKLGGPNTFIELGLLQVPKITSNDENAAQQQQQQQEEPKYLLAGMERNSHGNYFVVRNYDGNLYEALQKWVKPGTLVLTREAEELAVPEAYRHQLLEPELTVNLKVRAELPKLYEDIWRKQNEGNLWFALLDLLKLLRLANVVKEEQTEIGGVGVCEIQKEEKEEGDKEISS